DENGNGVPDGWQGKDKTGDKLMCNDEDHIFAHTGLCAFRFKGGPNEQSKLSQKVLLDGLNFAVDDQLNFSVYVNALKSKAKGTIKVRVKYGDLDTKGKITKQFVKTDGYEAVEGTIVIASTDVITIKVVFKHTSPSGKIYIDDGSIRWVSGGGAIALPLAP
ncbi:MAG TPA: hypothetical protein VHL11_07610, partial [Phototrophicaceae bacterium]|nr:hypothetical protein [Phototrophicaceae bacterium]